MHKVIEWAKSHPYESIGGGIVIFVLLLFFFRSSGSSAQAQGGEDPNVAAYLAAETAQTESGNALQATENQTTGAVAIAQTNAAANVAINNTWAATGVAEGEQATQQDLINQFGTIGSELGTTLTNSYGSSWNYGSSSSGFFGLGAGSTAAGGSSSGSSQSFVANSQQADAVNELAQIEQAEFHPMNG